MADRLVDGATALPGSGLTPFVSGYTGTRLGGFAPGVHAVLPSGGVTIVLALDQPIRFAGHFVAPAPTLALVAGPRMGSAAIRHEGCSFDIALGLTPVGVKALLGVTTADLVDRVVGLSDFWGGRADGLIEDLASAREWRYRFEVLDRYLAAEARDVSEGTADRAWGALASTGGRARVDDLADRVGYGRRHFRDLFSAEFGMTPKVAARLTRFERSVVRLRALERRRRRGDPAAGGGSIGLVAAECGFYDQAHMAREWKRLAGCSPSEWLRSEDLPFVQDADGTVV